MSESEKKEESKKDSTKSTNEVAETKAQKSKKKEASPEEKEVKEKAKLSKANQARLRMFQKNGSRAKEKPFRIYDRHPAKKAGDSVALVGTIDHSEYSHGYNDRDTAIRAMQDLNQEYFS